MRFFSYAGIVRVLISGNASNLVSGLNQALYQLLGIEMRTSSPYHSEGNASIERFWGTLRSLLSHLNETNNFQNWDLFLPYLLFCYQNVPNELTNVTPYELVFGHSCRNILDVLHDMWVNKEEYLPELTKKDQEYFEGIKGSIKLVVEGALERKGS